MVTRISRRRWIALSVVLFVVAMLLPALGVRPVNGGVQFGSIAGYLCLMFGWLLFTLVTKGLTVFFALSWLGNVAWALSLISLARNSGRRAGIFAVAAVVLALLVLIPIVVQGPVFDGEADRIYGIGPGYVLWLGALATPLIAAVVARQRGRGMPAAATAE